MHSHKLCFDTSIILQRDAALEQLSTEEQLALLYPDTFDTGATGDARDYLTMVQPHKGNVLGSAAHDLSPASRGAAAGGGVFGAGVLDLDIYRPADRLPSLNVHNATTRGDSPVDTPADTPAAPGASPQTAAKLQTKGSGVESTGSDAAPGTPENAHTGSKRAMRTAQKSFSANSNSPPPLLPTNSKANAKGATAQRSDAQQPALSGKGPGSLASHGKHSSQSLAFEHRTSTGDEALRCY